MDIHIDRLEIKAKIKEDVQNNAIDVAGYSKGELELYIEKLLERKIREMMNN